MAQDLSQLREQFQIQQSLASHFGEIVECAAAAVLAFDGTNPPDLKTQLSGLLGVAALAQDPREVRAFLMYQIARNRNWGGLGDRIVKQLGELHNLPGVAAAGGTQQSQMVATRVYLGHIRRLYTYIARAADDNDRAKRWSHVRHIAGSRATDRQAQGDQRNEDRGRQR